MAYVYIGIGKLTMLIKKNIIDGPAIYMSGRNWICQHKINQCSVGIVEYCNKGFWEFRFREDMWAEKGVVGDTSRWTSMVCGLLFP